MLFSKLVDNGEPDIVSRAMIFSSRIAESDDNVHDILRLLNDRKNYFFSSFGGAACFPCGAAAAGAPSAPSSTFLPLAITSGSAASSATAAAGVSSFSTVGGTTPTIESSS